MKIKQFLKFIKKHSGFLYFVIYFGSIYLVDLIGKYTNGLVSWISWIAILAFSIVATMVIYSWQECKQ